MTYTKVVHTTICRALPFLFQHHTRAAGAQLLIDLLERGIAFNEGAEADTLEEFTRLGAPPVAQRYKKLRHKVARDANKRKDEDNTKARPAKKGSKTAVGKPTAKLHDDFWGTLSDSQKKSYQKTKK